VLSPLMREAGWDTGITAGIELLLERAGSADGIGICSELGHRAGGRRRDLENVRLIPCWRAGDEDCDRLL